ncbi:MAG: exosortase system-associated protein, TIGR04073 family [Methylococcaceae bacterium]|nr:exosortase system-associated protein, TIGR04073 family [Methylococcaceae bacterium]
MKLNTRRFTALLIAGWLAFTPWAQADEIESYGQTTGRKALSGMANIGTSFLELPKNVINYTNESNFAFGFGFGTLQGIVDSVWRIAVGVSDLILAPLPTQPVVYPLYVWQDFETDTTYGPIFRLCTPTDNPCIYKHQ